MPKSKYNTTDSNDPDYYYGPDYFIGSLDDVRFYNAALSDNDILIDLYGRKNALVQQPSRGSFST